MSARIGDHIRSNAFTYVVLFLALTVVPAYAASKVKKNSVGSKQIKNGQVLNPDLGANAVSSDKVADFAVTIPKLSFDPATQAELDAHASSAAHDSRYFTETELQTSDGTAPNTGSNFVHWNILHGVPADFADGTDATGADWSLTGNAGTSPASNFLGTTDNQPLILRVNNAAALRLEPASDGTNQAPNLIGGSASNTVSPGVHSATISGGGRSSASDPATANQITDNGGTVAGGANNQAGDLGAVDNRPFGTVGGGSDNTASGAFATVAGGDTNVADTAHATVGGGDTNVANGFESTVAGGQTNTAGGTSATVGGGDTNTANGIRATVAGGISNDASGAEATIPGGNSNTAAGDFSFVTGLRAKNSNAAHDGVFLFADSTPSDFTSSAANEFAVRASGGLRLRTSSNLATGCDLPAGSGTFACTSDRNAKDDFAAVSPRQVLAQLSRMPIESWVYEDDPEAVRHIGPTAQAFKRAFGVGEDPRTISTVDADGVALAAIKGLDQRLDALSGVGPSAYDALSSPVPPASGDSLGPAALTAIVLLAAMLASMLTAALTLRGGRLRGRLATS